ncbi:hypothetical protein RchiOBHm_Chr6g0250191 [Rosa chinensis]|uniref:eIF2D winged helix domain-containing protein n=1 Tax=Rosa chinensis TaxID=74649 RepID=A0A2P6PKG8_ROSCH|nr:hypothetical protein RchiOBHm_Chr6g0250191 [Rosa chinensis]
MFLQSLVVPLLPILQWIKSPNNHNRRRKIHPRNIHRLRPEHIHHRVVPIRPLRQKTPSASIPSALCSPAVPLLPLFPSESLCLIGYGLAFFLHFPSSEWFHSDSGFHSRKPYMCDIHLLQNFMIFNLRLVCCQFKVDRSLHCYLGIYFFFFRESVEGPYVPNAGFLEDAVFEDPTLSSAQISDSYNGANDGSHDQLNGIDDKEMGQHVDVADVQSEPSSASVAPIDVRNEIAEEVTANVGDLKLTDDDSANQSTGEDQHPLSAEGVDMLLEKCLLQALHTTVKDKDLPMPGSTLWSNYVLPCRPSGITLDIKKSSHKKLSKWLQAKCSTGLIRVKEDKYKKESVLLSIDRSHPDYSSFKPEKQQVEEAACSNWCSCCQ